jgi:hypothetical protein
MTEASKDQPYGVDQASMQGRFDLREAIRNVGQILAIGGVLLYAILSISYQRFYGQLGVDPSDVGFTYTTILATSVGLIVGILVDIVLLVGLPIVGGILLIRARRKGRLAARLRRAILTGAAPPSPTSEARWRREDQRIVLTVVFVCVSITLFIIGYLLPKEAGDYARWVKDGYPVAPPRLGFPVFSPNFVPPALAIHADWAYVVPTGSAGPAVTALQTRPLFYLGKADSILVFYDVATHQALHLPSSSVLLKVGENRAGESFIVITEWYRGIQIECADKINSKDPYNRILRVGTDIGKLTVAELVEEIRAGRYFYTVPDVGHLRTPNDVIIASDGGHEYVKGVLDAQQPATLLELPGC